MGADVQGETRRGSRDIFTSSDCRSLMWWVWQGWTAPPPHGSHCWGQVTQSIVTRGWSSWLFSAVDSLLVTFFYISFIKKGLAKLKKREKKSCFYSRPLGMYTCVRHRWQVAVLATRGRKCYHRKVEIFLPEVLWWSSSTSFRAQLQRLISFHLWMEVN